jgi:predicted TIM-barrel fold metal-dependent hydrolase
VTDSGRRYVLISSDAHAGADLLDYKPYLERRFHEEFDDWAASFQDPWSNLDLELAQDDPNLHLGPASFLSPYNWDSDKRLEHMNSQGIAAEVVFPNTVPPFYPSGFVTAGAPSTAEEYRLRWAGVQAHNRWLAAFCSEASGRRGGLAQVFLNEVDDAIAEVRWAKDQGLAGILIPPDHISKLVNLYERHLDPFWAACSDLGMAVHRHTVSVNPPESADTGPAAPAIGAHECFLLFGRGLGHLVLGGVFERFPDLKFVFTETGLTWVMMLLQQLELECRHGTDKRTTLYPHFHRAIEALSQTPTEYFRRNCYLGASLMMKADVDVLHQLGVDRVMWGADYPHHEGTYPHTLTALRVNFSGLPESEVRAMTSLNAAEVYGFDLDHLQTIADQIGPSPDQVATPVPRDELPRDSRCMTIADALDPLY